MILGVVLTRHRRKYSAMTSRKKKRLRSAEYLLRGLSHVKIDVIQAGSAAVAILLSEYNAVHLLAIAIEE